MYQQWNASVLTFLKRPTANSLVFFSEYNSRTAILTQPSVITCKQNFYSFSCIGFTCLAFTISFFDWCLLLMVSLLNYQGMKSCKGRESFCVSILIIYTNDWSTFWHVYWCHVWFFFCEIPKCVQTKNRPAHLD